MSDVKGVEVNIMGREFTIACPPEERDSLLSAVSYLDKKMCDIRDAGKVVGVERIAMMAALNLAHELLTTRTGGVDVGGMKGKIAHMQRIVDDALTEQNNLF
ncbi:MAG: cell division protein ZapA [Burkholderiaceae bacterium]|nr:cell division protein ZapA [Burkholderiaceae bacterium]